MKTSTVRNIEQVVKQPDKLLTIRADDTVAQAAVEMTENQVGCLIVLDEQDKFAGIVTERDILSKVITKSLAPDKLHVRDIMTTDVVSCIMDTPVAKIEQLMAEHKIRHIPIIEDGVPLGMVSSRDLVAHQLINNQAMKNAAEQLAMLPAGLKSLDFEDVVALAINEVPKSFNADHAALHRPKRLSARNLSKRKSARQRNAVKHRKNRTVITKQTNCFRQNQQFNLQRSLRPVPNQRRPAVRPGNPARHLRPVKCRCGSRLEVSWFSLYVLAEP